MKPHGVSLFDARPFFEKALVYGVQHGILDAARLETMCNDAPKGMVQIARYFGTEFLRPDLEKARDRMVNLVSLYLEDSTDGDLRTAAESLRDHSFLSRSKGGSDMLKALIAMPQNSHFGMHESTEFTEEQIPLLAKWSLRSLPEYQAELALRSQIALLVDAAIWFAEALGQDVSDLEEAGKDAEAVIRTGLLSLTTRRKDMPDWVAFEKMIAALRKKRASNATDQTESHGNVSIIPLPKDLPERFRPIVEGVRQTVISDLPKILEPTASTRKLFDQTPAFMGRYFWLEDPMSEIDHFERTTSAIWDKACGGHGDDSSLLTLFLCLAAGSTPRTLLTEKAAATLVRKIRKSGIQAPLAEHFILSHAPQNHQSDYLELWESFIAEAMPTLQSDFDYALKDALALLRRECNIGP
ncbi:MAG: hypothetical protein WCH60_00540 [Burkholderiales bacterium]